MNAAMLSRTLSLIPDRVARLPTGSAFDAAGIASDSACCAHPERLAHLLPFLQWLGPLHPLSKEDQRVLGLLSPYARASAGMGDEAAEELAGEELGAEDLGAEGFAAEDLGEALEPEARSEASGAALPATAS